MAGIPQEVQEKINAIGNALDSNNERTDLFIDKIGGQLRFINTQIERLKAELNDARALAERAQQQPMPPLPPTPNTQVQDCQQYVQVINNLHGRIGDIIGNLERSIGQPMDEIIKGFGGNGSNNGGGGQRGGSRRRRKMHSKKRKHHRSRKI
jgi:hypothetical protein